MEVLNGVNLDVLGRRDPEMYGGLSLNELESQIYTWGKELGLGVRCRQTNDEGQYIEWLHEVFEMADGVVVNPAAWTHYSYAIRDAVAKIKSGEIQDLSDLNFADLVTIQELQIDDSDPLRAELESFINAVKNRSQPEVSADDGLAAVELATRIVQSIATQRLA